MTKPVGLFDPIDRAGEAAPAAEAAQGSLVRSLARDIALNASVPLACYYLAKRFVSPSELVALLLATAFPTLKSVHDVLRRHELDPVAVLVLLGLVTSIFALFVGGNPRVLLIRESFFTGAFGLACIVSLMFPRPIMFYFGRHFMAGKDPAKRKLFDARWENPIARRAHRLVTIVWGLVYVGEFGIRVALVYTLSIPVVLTVSPFLMGIPTIATIAWTFRFAYKTRGRLVSVGG
jgi:hypothetical protein